MKKHLIHFILLLTTTLALAQSPQGNSPRSNLKIGRVYGKLIDAANKQTVPYASVTVVHTIAGRDSIFGGALSGDNGEFNITELPMGGFIVKVSFMGYKDFAKSIKITPPDNVEEDLGDIKLTTDAKMLNAVEITGDKVSTQISLEKRVFNVDKNITSSGGTAEDILKNVPSVTVDVDGNAQLRNNATTVYVDGKPSLLAINQIPADQVESVEVISNPSAKYDASTTGGIVNLVLKKNRKPGYNGMIGLGIGTNNRYNGLLNLNMHQGKWNFTGFYNINSAKNPAEGYTNRINRTSDGTPLNYFNQTSNTTLDNTFQTGKLGIDYALNNRNTLSLTGTIAAGHFDINTMQNFSYSNAANVMDSTGKRTMLPQNNFTRQAIEGSWKKTFAKKGEILTASANYTWGGVANTATWKTFNYDANNQLKSSNPDLVDITGTTKTNQALFQVDFTNPLNDSTKLEMGVRSQTNWSNQQYFYNNYSYEKQADILNLALSQDAIVTQGVNAAYITYSSRFKNQINYQIGVRFEQSNLNGSSQLAGVSDFGYQFPSKASDIWKSFFPSLFLSKKLDENTEIGFNISRKINRPNFRQLMPSVQAADKQNIQVGNPALQPEFLDKAEFNYNKKFGENNLLSTIYLNYEENTIKPFTSPSTTDPSVLITTFVNGTNQISYGTDNTFRWALNKKLELTTNVNVFYTSVSVANFTNSGWSLNAKESVQWKLPADFSVQASGGYIGKQYLAQGYVKPIPSADFAVKKSFFHNMGSATFSINDVFNSRKNITIYDTPNLYQEVMRRRDVRFYKIAVQIPFGKADASIFKKKKQEGQQQDMDFGG